MDGTMWMHHPRTPKMREFLSDSHQFGKLKAIHSVFSYNAGEDFLKNDIRVQPDLDALGALGDSGWYCIRAILWATDYEMPKTVTALREPEFNEAGVILSCGASLSWEDGKLATFYCSFLTNLTMDISALGTKLLICCRWAGIPEGADPPPTVHSIETDLPHEAHMVAEFSKLVENIKSNGGAPETKWASISRKTQIVVDAVMASIAKGFEPIEIN
ncbi:hypothetical protein Leryth_013631 [Lithospermum erythrorhizon]|nr:hypothetical protein Leryth_013631 [Lithospermum erythrorhizon]